MHLIFFKMVHFNKGMFHKASEGCILPVEFNVAKISVLHSDTIFCWNKFKIMVLENQIF